MRRSLNVVVTALMLLQGVLWLAFGAYQLVTAGSQMPLISVLMLGNGALFTFFGLFHKKEKRWIAIAALLFLTANLILTVTDQMGLYDYLVLALDVLSIAGVLSLYIITQSAKPASKEN